MEMEKVVRVRYTKVMHANRFVVIITMVVVVVVVFYSFSIECQHTAYFLHHPPLTHSLQRCFIFYDAIGAHL